MSDTDEFTQDSLGDIGEVIQGASFCAGQVSGKQSMKTFCVNIILEAAKIAFANGKDEKAQELRSLSRQVEGVADKDIVLLQKLVSDSYRPREQAAFAELTRRDEHKQ